MSFLRHLLCAMRYLMYQHSMSDTANHALPRHQARTAGGGGEKESSVPELCSLESVCRQAFVYRHITKCAFTTIFINSKYSITVTGYYIQSESAITRHQTDRVLKHSTSRHLVSTHLCSANRKPSDLELVSICTFLFYIYLWLNIRVSNCTPDEPSRTLRRNVLRVKQLVL